MDPISPAARREALHEQISEAQMILRRAAAAAALKSDPLAEQLQALAVCRKNIQQDASGRHYCMLPVWTDRISPAVPTAPVQ